MLIAEFSSPYITLMDFFLSEIEQFLNMGFWPVLRFQAAIYS